MNRQHTQLVNRLEASGEELVARVGKLTPEELAAAPAGEWSLHQQLTHLRDTEQHVFWGRAQRIMKQDNPAVENFDQEEYMRAHYDAAEPVKQIMGEFRQARRRFVRLLRQTRDADWMRTARHPEYGMFSLEYLVLHGYAHTLDHLAQILYLQEQTLRQKLNRSA